MLATKKYIFNVSYAGQLLLGTRFSASSYLKKKSRTVRVMFFKKNAPVFFFSV